jgi:hypothetical protein
VVRRRLGAGREKRPGRLPIPAGPHLLGRLAAQRAKRLRSAGAGGRDGLRRRLAERRRV